MDLNRTDMEVMAAYLRNPSASAEEIADILGISRWTVSKSRKKLIESEVLRFIWVPDFRSIGAEILFSGFVSAKTQDKRMPETIFFSSMEDTKGFCAGIASNYTVLYEEMLDFSETLMNVEGESFKFALFPLKITDIWRMADFYHLISSEYKISIPKIKKHHPDSRKEHSFKEGEKEVYAELVENPTWSGEKIARKLGTTRQRVLRLRSKFEEEGFFEKKAILNLQRLGYEVMLSVSWKMKPEIYRKMSKKIGEHPLSPIIFGASTPLQGIALAVFRNFRESREIIAQLSSWAKPEKNIIGEPNILFFSIQDAKFSRYFDFGWAVKKLLKAP